MKEQHKATVKFQYNSLMELVLQIEENMEKATGQRVNAAACRRARKQLTEVSKACKTLRDSIQELVKA